MTTLIYTPGAAVVIESHRDGLIDISEDISAGSINLKENANHELSLTVENPLSKYDGAFAPNDRITLQLKRFRWLQIFTGYLDSVPYFSAYPRPIRVERFVHPQGPPEPPVGPRLGEGVQHHPRSSA